MKAEHITHLLDQSGAPGLRLQERDRIEAHTSSCAECRKTYFAACVAERLIKARAGETIPPSPFFAGRVMAVLRERNAQRTPPLQAIWSQLRSLLASIIAVVAVLLVLTIYTGVRAVTVSDSLAEDDVYSAEWTLVDGDDVWRDASESQVLTTLYASMDTDGPDN
jgi:hypothetical protein